MLILINNILLIFILYINLYFGNNFINNIPRKILLYFIIINSIIIIF